MAGVKGKSGGARPGAGRKPKPQPEVQKLSASLDMLSMLQQVALGQVQATPLQVRAAIAAVQYTHAKKGEAGKKDEKQSAADRVASKFGARPAPLKLVNGK